MGYAVIEIGLTNSLWCIIVYFVNPILLFVILYMVCRRNFIENVASIITSIIVGTVTGYWIGGLLSFTLFHSIFPTSPWLFIFSGMLYQFAACSAAYVNSKWKFLMPKKDIAPKRPFGVALISALYIVLGILLVILTCITFGLFYIFSFELLLSKTLLFAGLILLLAIASVMYFVVAYEFYKGNRWGWLIIFASTVIGIFLSINQLLFGFYFDVWLIVKILAFMLDVFVLIYLLQPHVRIYFGIVNPMSENTSEINSDFQS